MLISITGCTGLTMPDRPLADPRDGKPIMAKPNLTMPGRTAGSPDNAQGTHFFLINDTGTYFLRKLPPPADGSVSVFDEETLLARAAEAKVKLLDHRIDVGDGNRDFPAYLDSNRFLSNLPGTTILFPVVDLSRQYINGMMYLLTQPEGARPTIVDDRNFYRMAGVKKWVDSGFLNKDIKLPLGTIWAMRTQIEADLLLQNLMLTADAMGLGAWIHASIAPPVLLGDPKFRGRYGAMLGLRLDHPEVEAAGHPALARAAAEVRRPPGHHDRAAAQGGAPDQGDVPAELRHDGRRRRRRRGGQVRTRRHLHGRGAVRAHLPRRVRCGVPRGGQRLLRRRDRLHPRHLHLHLRDPRPLPGAQRHDPRPRRLAPGPPPRERLLREVLPQRDDRGAPEARREMASERGRGA